MAPALSYLTCLTRILASGAGDFERVAISKGPGLR
jgi:hypothetical protein